MTQLDICSVITAGFAKLKSTKNDMSAIRQIQQMQCFLGQIRGEILKGLYSCHDNTFFDASKIYHIYEERSDIGIGRHLATRWQWAALQHRATVHQTGRDAIAQ